MGFRCVSEHSACSIWWPSSAAQARVGTQGLLMLHIYRTRMHGRYTWMCFCLARLWRSDGSFPTPSSQRRVSSTQCSRGRIFGSAFGLQKPGSSTMERHMHISLPSYSYERPREARTENIDTKLFHDTSSLSPSSSPFCAIDDHRQKGKCSSALTSSGRGSGEYCANSRCGTGKNMWILINIGDPVKWFIILLFLPFLRIILSQPFHMARIAHSKWRNGWIYDKKHNYIELLLCVCSCVLLYVGLNSSEGSSMLDTMKAIYYATGSQPSVFNLFFGTHRHRFQMLLPSI